MTTTTAIAEDMVGKSYYTAGSTEIATETPVTLNRLEQRRKLTHTGTRLVIVLVGLPARGKSFVSRKLHHYLNWTGAQCRIFNVGRYRREAYSNFQLTRHSENPPTERDQKGSCDANFFDANNQEASELRERVAEIALNDMLRWLDDEEEEEDQQQEDYHDEETNGSTVAAAEDMMSKHSSASSLNSAAAAAAAGGAGAAPSMPGVTAKLNFKRYERVAIFDATNSTHKRRNWILEKCTSPVTRRNKPTGVVFVESICDDQELLEENYRYKIKNSPDFDGMSAEEALQDLRKRVKKYEEQYETITDEHLTYIKVYNLSTKLMLNHCYGRMAKELVPALMSWHIGTRPVFLCRPGQTISGIMTDGEDYVARNKIDPKDPRFLDMSGRSRRKNFRGDKLGPLGSKFRHELLDFCYDEAHSFMLKRASVRDMSYTGTSISGLAPIEYPVYRHESTESSTTDHHHHEQKDPFPLKILTSTMPRAADTVNWREEYSFNVHQVSNLNPLDKGDFAGMELEEIKKVNPTWYEKLEQDPFGTRFPGGESYRDLIRRLTSVVIDVEQQVIPTLVVSHVSILQCLIAYFRNSPIEKCMSIEVPMHTVIKFTPVGGGGWSETRLPLQDDNMMEQGLNGGGSGSGGGGNASPIHPVESISEMSAMTTEDVSPIWGDHLLVRKVIATGGFPGKA